jgi:hypothetical protein
VLAGAGLGLGQLGAQGLHFGPHGRHLGFQGGKICVHDWGEGRPQFLGQRRWLHHALILPAHHLPEKAA